MSIGSQLSKVSKVLLFIIMSFLLLTLGAFSVLATEGSRGGSGGGSANPLSLVSSEPAAGAKDVPLESQITLTFSKNIVNMTVKDKNMNCFTLQNSKGQTVPMEITMADDQIEVEKKNDVILKPRQLLAKGETYTVVISPELTSKNGSRLEKETKLSFSTIGSTTNKAAESGNSSNSSLLLPVVIIALILVGGFFFYKTRKR